MADKRIFRKLKHLDGVDSGLFDSWTKKNIPLDEQNADYRTFLRMELQGRALALEAGEVLPDGVTDAPLRP